MNKLKEPALNSYLITCFRDWIIDCNLKPYIQVDASQLTDPKLKAMANNGVLVLNISPFAIANYHLDNDGMSFNVKFNGIDHHVTIPLSAILLIGEPTGRDYAKQCVLPPLPIPLGKPTVVPTKETKVSGVKVVSINSFPKK